MQIHPSAIVHPKAELADDVTVQAYSIIEENVRIGAGSDYRATLRCRKWHCNGR